MEEAIKTICRRNGPKTSVRAAKNITANGTRLTQNDQIVVYLATHPGATVWDIGDGTGINYLRVAKRMGEIRTMGYEPREEVYVEATESYMQTWWPVEQAVKEVEMLF